MISDANFRRLTYTGLVASALALALAAYTLYKIRPTAAGDDQPITMTGGSIKLETYDVDPWHEGTPGNNKLLTYDQSKPTDSTITKLGQLELRGTDSAGNVFDYLAYRDPTSDLRIEIEFSKKLGVDPITRVLLESPKNSSTKRDDVFVTVISTSDNRHEFKYKKNGLREIDEPGWKIQKVILRSGLIVVPGTTPLPTEIAVTHQDFYMRLHDCPLDSTHTDGRCRP